MPFDRLRPNVLSRGCTAVTDTPARPAPFGLSLSKAAWGITLLRANVVPLPLFRLGLVDAYCEVVSLGEMRSPIPLF